MNKLKVTLYALKKKLLMLNTKLISCPITIKKTLKDR